MNDNPTSLCRAQLSEQRPAILNIGIGLTQMHYIEALGKEAPNDGSLPVDSLGQRYRNT